MSQYLANVCGLLIEEAYGALSARLFSTLTKHGRLGIKQLVQHCHLPSRQVKHGLSSLVQAQLLYYDTTTDGRTFYEANIKHAYNLLRSGRVISITEEHLGKVAAFIITNLLLAGHASIETIRCHFNISNGGENGIFHSSWLEERKDEGTNGSLKQDDHDHARHINRVLEGLNHLVQNELVLCVRDAHFHTSIDNYVMAKDYVIAQQKHGTTSRREQEEIDEKAWQEVLSRNDATIASSKEQTGDPSCLKRSYFDEEASSRKKLRLTNGDTYKNQSLHVDDVTLLNEVDENMVICVNYDKVAQILRNSRLVDEVRRRVSVSASHTYASILRQLSDQTNRQMKARARHERDDLQPNMGDINLGAIKVPSRPVKTPFPHLNGYVNGHTSDDESNVPEDEQLRVLGKEPYFFVTRNPTTGGWVVDFSDLCTKLRLAEIFRLIKIRLGGIGLRIFKILLEKGKLDEKTLQEISLLSARDLRQHLARLKSAGFLELQEVPREPQRQPSRTLYLWYVDPDRARGTLLADIYKAMARLLKRMKVERERIASLLDKAERTDIRGREEEHLASEEITMLKLWRRKEEWLLGELGRLDESVATLRDNC